MNKTKQDGEASADFGKIVRDRCVCQAKGFILSGVEITGEGLKIENATIKCKSIALEV